MLGHEHIVGKELLEYDELCAIAQERGIYLEGDGDVSMGAIWRECDMRGYGPPEGIECGSSFESAIVNHECAIDFVLFVWDEAGIGYVVDNGRHAIPGDFLITIAHIGCVCFDRRRRNAYRLSGVLVVCVSREKSPVAVELLEDDDFSLGIDI